MPIGAIIGAGASLLGGHLAAKNQKRASAREYARQKEFAQHGIQWKAADAEAAGISKLYALGANTTSYAPQSVGGSDHGLAAAGQDIGRAISATQSGNQRANKFTAELQRTQLEGARLDNEFKRTQIASAQRTLTQPGSPPAPPGFETTPHIPGQGNSRVTIKKSIAPAGHSPEASYGVHPEVDWYRGNRGYTPQIPQNLAESFEQNWLGSLGWQLRNSLGPYLGLSTSKPPKRPGYHAQFHPWHGWQYKKNPNNLPKGPLKPRRKKRRYR